MALMVMSALGSSIWYFSSRKDGIAMPTRMSTGMIVQAISSPVWCVVRDGVGLAFSLNFTTTATSRASTKSVIAVMIQTSAVWKSCTNLGHRGYGVLKAHLPGFGMSGRRRKPDRKC